MIDALFAPENLPFSVCLAVMVIIALLEGIASLFGHGLSHALESMSADVDADVHLHDGLSHEGSDSAVAPLSKLLGWFRVGQLPILMILIVFLTAFGLFGLVGQVMVSKLIGQFLSPWIMVPAALVLTLPTVHVVTGVLAELFPKDESEAVSADELVGRVATIVLGTAAHKRPAEARVVDRFGHTHYVMVAPDSPDASFRQGASVLLSENHGHFYTAVVYEQPEPN